MITAQFSAFCPFEIGDRIRDITGRVHESRTLRASTTSERERLNFVLNWTIPGSMRRLRFRKRRQKCGRGWFRDNARRAGQT